VEYALGEIQKLKIEKIVVGEIKTNCYLASIDNDLFVVDPGGDAALIIQQIEKIKEVNVRYVLLTHGHYDHILAVDDLSIKYPKASIVIHDADLELYNKLPDQGTYLGKNFHRLSATAVPMAEGSTLNFGDKKIEIIHTPGHTKGSACYIYEDVIFSGDTIFYHNYGRIDLPWSEPGSMKDSIETFLKLPEEFRILPGHGPETTVEEERKFKGFGSGKYL